MEQDTCYPLAGRRRGSTARWSRRAVDAPGIGTTRGIRVRVPGLETRDGGVAQPGRARRPTAGTAGSETGRPSIVAVLGRQR